MDIPVTYQALQDYYGSLGAELNFFTLREKTMKQIELATGRPLICYITKTHNLPPAPVPAYVDDSDVNGFNDLIQTTEGESLDVFVVSNGGSAEAAERIVQLLRGRFKEIRYIIPSNAFSAATLMCFSGDEVIMTPTGTLGPTDPQINGVPARAILRAFENLEQRFQEEGPGALTPYMPLLDKYPGVHFLEICKSAQELSDELAKDWLSSYMLNCDSEDEKVKEIIEFFASYDTHKSHGRSINRAKAAELGLKVVNAEDIDELADLATSLYNQYEIWFDQSPFFKSFENVRGIHWGRQAKIEVQQLPQGMLPMMSPLSGPPMPSA